VVTVFVLREARLRVFNPPEILGGPTLAVAVILAALVLVLTGWTLADLIVGAAIGLFIVRRTWILLKGALRILLEGTPPNVDTTLLRTRLAEIPVVIGVHDLHAWTLTSGLDAMSCHLVVEHADPSRDVLVAAQAAMH
jgi:cobalt-zinc-cadmium efflux system protein